LAVGNTVEQRETGDRRNGWRLIFRSQVSAVGYLVQVFRFRCRFGAGINRFSPLPSVIDSVIDPVIVPFRVAGGSSGWQVAGLIHSALHSVLCHPSSVIDSVIDSAAAMS
jgi:hypothetical protein